MPPQQSVRRHDRGYLLQGGTADPVCARSQATAIVVGETQPTSAKLAPQKPVFLDEVGDCLPLPTVQPPRQHTQHQPQRREVNHEPELYHGWRKGRRPNVGTIRVRKHGKGDQFRNVIEQRYLKSVQYAKNAAAEAERQKFQAVVELFKKYGAQYNGDYLLMAAQGYQESALDHTVKSPVGAIGVMQVMPPTGKALKVGDISDIEPNIHAGVKYMRFMMDQYFKDEPMDNLNKALMTFASYNAGPGRLRQLRLETQKKGLDPNVWFGNVERVASERIGRETVTYVSNIYKYYITYRLLSAQRERREAAKAEVEKRK
jgi:hypothetical protein